MNTWQWPALGAFPRNAPRRVLAVIVIGGVLGVLGSCGARLGSSTLDVASTENCRVEPRPKGDQPLTPLALGLNASSGSVDYDTSVKPLIETQCIRCHTSSSRTNLSTYQLVVVAIDKVIDQVNRDLMPPGAPLSEGDKGVFVQWKAAGMPQKISAPFATGEDETGSVASGDAPKPAEGQSATTPATGQAPTQSGARQGLDTRVLRPMCGNVEVLDLRLFDGHPAMRSNDVAVCRLQGVLFDRNTLVCSDVKVAKGYECTRAGLQKAFAAHVPGGIGAVLNRTMGDPSRSTDYGQFYSIDQCGETSDGKPFAFLMRLIRDNESGPSGVSLQVMELKVGDQ